MLLKPGLKEGQLPKLQQCGGLPQVARTHGAVWRLPEWALRPMASAQ